MGPGIGSLGKSLDVEKVLATHGYRCALKVDRAQIKYIQASQVSNSQKRLDIFVKPEATYVFFLVGSDIVADHEAAFKYVIDECQPEESLEKAVELYEKTIYPFVKATGSTRLSDEILRQLGR